MRRQSPGERGERRRGVVVPGYRTGVNWIASAALDLLLFDWFQYYDDTRRLWRDFRRDYSGLIGQTGIEAFHGHSMGGTR
jgi:hypothetical protein